MPRGRELPESLSESAAELVVELRTVKSRSGMTLVALERKTPYSKSSWERYLNGRTLPSADAVRALCTAAGCDPAPLLALREVAVAEVAARKEREERDDGVAAGVGPEPRAADAGHDPRRADAVSDPEPRTLYGRPAPLAPCS
ncbi:helix-turn-helix domain-containing protein [Streptomyces sp. CA-146814]|uniref:helix-turn-helix domain-containing protein n=1 Tax=Streptomyces sp. CA-146814 TaxID=3240053 RepID=UPI003D8D86C5